MPTETLTHIPQPVRQAIEIAPADPDPSDGRITQLVEGQIQNWAVADSQFAQGLETLSQFLTTEEYVALEYYLAATAISLASNKFDSVEYIPDEILKNEEQQAGTTIFQFLTDENSKSEKEAHFLTWQKIRSLPLRESILEKQVQLLTPLPKETDPGRPEKIKVFKLWLKNEIGQKKQIVADRGYPLEIRELLDLYNKAASFAKTIYLDDPPVFNLTIGDVELLNKNLEPEFSGLPEKLGLTGPKAKRIHERIWEYKQLKERSEHNIYGYQPLALGWENLRRYHEKYLNFYGLDKYVSGYIGMGVSESMDRAFSMAREFLRDERNTKIASEKNLFRKWQYRLIDKIKGPYQPKVIFSTPGFTVMGKLAQNLGMEVIQMETVPEDDFMYDPDILEKFLADPKNSDTGILVLTPVNNPSSRITPADRIRQINAVLETHYQKTGRRIVVINDLAYLGTGNEALNRQLGQAISEYKFSFDIMADTKILARPAERCGFAATRSEELAKYIPPITRLKVPSLSYDMMLGSLATWDLVSMEDMNRLFDLYSYRQQKLLSVLSRRPDLFDIEKTGLQLDRQDPDNSNAALYAWVTLKDGIDPLDLIAETGIFGTVSSTFYMPQANQEGKAVKPVNRMRYAIGVEPMTDENIARLEEALNVPTQIADNA